MERIRRSWQLFKKSVSVMFEHKELLIFPIVIVALTLCIGAIFVIPMLGGLALEGAGAMATHRPLLAKGFNPANLASYNPVVGLDIVCLYFVSMVSATYFNVAFYHEIMEALQDRPVSIVRGLNFALTRWKSILLWSVFAGIVGFLISKLEQKFGFIGRIVIGMVGLAWSVACVFVVPVIIVEEHTSNPFALLKKSVLTLRQAWGESLAGYVGVAVGGWLVMVFSVVWLGGAMAVSFALHSVFLGALAFVFWVVAVAIFAYLSSVANQIFRCALFLYASTGAMPRPFDNDMAALAWKTK